MQRSKLGGFPNWGRLELGAQSGRKKQPACLPVRHSFNKQYSAKCLSVRNPKFLLLASIHYIVVRLEVSYDFH